MRWASDKNKKDGSQYGATYYIWQHTYQVGQEIKISEQISNPANTQQTTITRGFVPTTRQVGSDTTITGEREIVKNITYAHEIYNETDGMLERNRLTAIAQTDLYFKDLLEPSPQSIMESSAITTYHKVPKWPQFMPKEFVNDSVWKIHQHYKLNTDEDLLSPPSFNNWNGGSTPDSRWQKKYEAIEYKYGKMINVEDGNGYQLELFYGDNNNNLVNSDNQNDFAHAYLTGVRLNQLKKEFDYHTRFFQINKFTDESDNIFEHLFDNFGRLNGIKNANQQQTNEYEYEFSRQPATPFDPANPNYIKTRCHFSTTKYADVYEYYDGNAERIQVVVDTSIAGAGNNGYDYYTATELDEMGRVKKQYKPYKKPALAGRPDYDPDYAYRNENGVNTGSPTERFSENHYNSFLDHQLLQVDFPGPKDSSNSNFYDYEYVLAENELPQIYSAGSNVVWRKRTTTDEIGDSIIIFEDENGLQILKREFKLDDLGEPDSIHTYFEYDGNGNAVKVYPPNYFDPPNGTAEDWIITYEYNTLGQMIRQVSPDAGEKQFKYDANGNLRFTQDANQIVAGKVSFTTYDFANRASISGEAQADFSSLDGALSYAIFEEDSSNWLSVNHYDSSSIPNEYPWTLYDYSGITLNNTAGRLAANAFKTAGGGGDQSLENDTLSSPDPQTFRGLSSLTAGNNFLIENSADVVFKAGNEIRLQPGFTSANGSNFHALIDPILNSLQESWQVTLYSYDNNGQIEQKYIFTMGLADPTIFTYDYDLQGKITHLKTQQGTEEFYHWYDYNGRGELERTYTSTNGTKPATADLYNEYNPAGLISTLAFKETSPGVFLREFPFEYNIRDWLTDISDIDNLPQPFAARYDYYPDGNIQTATFYNEMVPQLPNEKKYRYDFTYDPRKQLLSADYWYEDSGNWQNVDRFDVNGLTYDPNSNILSLVRRDDSDGIIDDLDYQYGNKNQLQSVVENSTQTPTIDWDVENSQFIYDENGNLKSVSENGSYKIRNVHYDNRNLPIFVESSDYDEIIYLYNKDGHRIYKKVGSLEAEHYIMDGDENLALFDENGSLKYWNIFGNGLSGKRKASGEKLYYLKDHLGSTRAVVNDQDMIVESHDYYPFGLLMPGRDYQTAERTKELFTGKERDVETGWDYFGARYYSPAIGRWWSVDPILSRKSPLDLIKIGVISESPYVYTSNNPIIYVDKNGFVKWKVVGSGSLKFFGGLVGTGVSGYALVQTGGGAALFGATLGLTTGLATMSVGLGEIVAGFADKEYALSDGLIVAISTELGVDKQTALKLAMVLDLLSVGQSAANVISKTGTTLDEIALLLSSEALSDDIKEQIEEYIRSQEQAKEEQSDQEKKEEEKEKTDDEKEEEDENNNQ